MSKRSKTESLEEAIFKTLSNQKRRDSLRFIGERKEATFTEIKRAVEIEDSSLVVYHLKSLEGLIIQSKDKYRLSDLGQEAYTLIVKTNTYAGTNIILNALKKQLTRLIIANALLWAVALLTVSFWQESLNHAVQNTLVALWLVSNAIIYWITKSTNQKAA